MLSGSAVLSGLSLGRWNAVVSRLRESAFKTVLSTSVRSVSIPIDRLEFNFSRSSGPGGQNVNKVNTKAELRFNVHEADW